MKFLHNNLKIVLKKNFLNLLIFETGYRIASCTLLLVLTRQAIQLSLKVQGFSYLTAENYLEFLGHPISVLLFTGILMILLFLFSIETASLLNCFRHSYHGQKIFFSDILYEGMVSSWRLFRKKFSTWFLCAVMPAPFLTFYLLVREISYVQILEFTARQIGKMIPYQYLVILIVLVLLISFLFIFALPFCVLEGENWKKGLVKGFQMLRALLKKALSGFVILYLYILLLTGVLYLLSMAVMVLSCMVLKEDASVVSMVLIYRSFIDMGIGVAAGAIQMVGSTALLYVIYVENPAQKRKQTRPFGGQRVPRWFRKIGKRRFAAFICFLLVFFEGSYVVHAMMSHDDIVGSMLTSPQITAHRGGAGKAPENTICALKYSADIGADLAEIDVQETKDKELILLHDNSLKRTAGVKKKVWEMDYAQIKKLDAGVSFHEKFRGEKIPTLDEVLKFCKGKLDLNIEIKYNGKNRGIVKRVVRTIEKNKFEDHCVITSMNYGFLEQVKALNPAIRTGYIMTMRYGSVRNMEATDFFSVKYSYITDVLVKEAHAQGKEVHAWTVNYRGDVKNMLDMGVDNIITDDPVMVRGVMNQESDAKTGFFELMGYALGI